MLGMVSEPWGTPQGCPVGVRNPQQPGGNYRDSYRVSTTGEARETAQIRGIPGGVVPKHSCNFARLVPKHSLSWYLNICGKVRLSPYFFTITLVLGTGGHDADNRYPSVCASIRASG